MDALALRNKIEWEGSVLEALDTVSDEDIEDEDLSSLWYDLHETWERLSREIEEFEDSLNESINVVEID